MTSWGPAPREGSDATPLIQFGGAEFEPLPSGALFWRAERTLLVADLHLEKFSSYARTGQFLPPYDTGLTLLRLASDLATTRAQTVIALGDSFHRDEGTTTLLDTDRGRLMGLMSLARWVWLSGNHDPAPHRLGGECLTYLEHRGLTLRHEPRRGTPGLIAGHLHPAARVVYNGRSVRRPCFVHDGSTMILPAYGSGTGSLNITGPAFRGLFSWPKLEVAMLGRDRVYPVSRRHLGRG